MQMFGAGFLRATEPKLYSIPQPCRTPGQTRTRNYLHSAPISSATRCTPPNAKFSGVAGMRGAQRPNETTAMRARNIEFARDQVTSAAMNVRQFWLVWLTKTR